MTRGSLRLRDGRDANRDPKRRSHCNCGFHGGMLRHASHIACRPSTSCVFTDVADARLRSPRPTVHCAFSVCHQPPGQKIATPLLFLAAYIGKKFAPRWNSSISPNSIHNSSSSPGTLVETQKNAAHLLVARTVQPITSYLKSPAAWMAARVALSRDGKGLMSRKRKKSPGKRRGGRHERLLCGFRKGCGGV